MPKQLINLGEKLPLEIETDTEGGKVRVAITETASGKSVWFLLTPEDAKGIAADLIEMADDLAD